MGKQFKGPFFNLDERSAQVSSSTGITEQNTLPVPAANSPEAFPVQSLPGEAVGPDGLRVADAFEGRRGMYDRPSIYQTDRMSTDQIYPELVSGMPPGLPFDRQARSALPGGLQSAGPVHPSSGLPLTPVGNSPFFLPGGVGGMVEQQKREAVDGGAALNPAWSNQPSPARELREKAGEERGSKKAREGMGRHGKKKRRVPIWARVVISTLLFFIVLTGAGFAYYQVNYASVVNSVTSKPFARLDGSTDPNAGKSGSILNWGRINVLLLGSDTDEKPVWGGSSFLAQTVIVVSIDTNTHDVDMLSIPRDYYINIPGYGMDKLDTAFAHGGSINNNMSGVGTVAATLDRDFGIRINFYAWVGLQGFIKVIDTVGGVDVNVMHPVVDDTYPDDVGTRGSAQFGYKRVYIPDGPQHLDGPTALEYVRSRHSTNDFDRSARQQQVLSALKLKLQSASTITELPQIAKDLQGSVYTSLSPTQILDLGNFARNVDANTIKHLTLGGTKYSTSGQVTVSGGTEDVVYPRCAAIVPAINAFLHITTATCNITASAAQAVPALAAVTGEQNSGKSSQVDQTGISLASANEEDTSVGLTSYSDLFGIRDLLDLMSMVVLDSPQM